MKKLKIMLLTMMLIICCTVTAFAAEDVFTAGEALLTDAQVFLLKASTIIAVIGIAFGAFKCKFAGGNLQKIEMGYTAIKASIIGWALVNGSPLIFATIEKYI